MVEARQRRLGREGRTVAAQRAEVMGEPVLAVFTAAHPELFRPFGESLGTRHVEQGAYVAPEQVVGRPTEDAFRGWVGAGDGKAGVEDQNRVHGAVEQAGELILPCPRQLLGAQAPVLGGGPLREELENTHQPRLGRHRPGVEHRQVAEQLSVHVEQRQPHVADRVETGQVRVCWEELDDLVRKMGEGLVLDHRLAGGAHNIVFVVFDVLAVDPERQ